MRRCPPWRPATSTSRSISWGGRRSCRACTRRAPSSTTCARRGRSTSPDSMTSSCATRPEPSYHPTTSSPHVSRRPPDTCGRSGDGPPAATRGETRMRLSTRMVPLVVGVVALVAVVGTALGAYFDDWGLDRQTQMENKSQTLFGFGQPLTQSSTANLTQAQALADPDGLVTVAKGLKVGVVSAGKAPPNIDQKILCPVSNPQWILACNEEGIPQPSLVKISLATGSSTTIAWGIDSCDGIRATPWGTVLFAEEAGTSG